jgi:hypothetical protein
MEMLLFRSTIMGTPPPPKSPLTRSTVRLEFTATTFRHGRRSGPDTNLGFGHLGDRPRPGAGSGQPGWAGRDVLCISSRDGQPFSVIGFTVTDGQISEIDILMDPDRLRQLDLSALDDQRR